MAASSRRAVEVCHLDPSDDAGVEPGTA